MQRRTSAFGARGRRLVMTPTRSPIEAADVLVRHSDSRQRFCRLMRVGRRLRRPLAFRMTRSRSRCRQGADSPPIPSGVSWGQAQRVSQYCTLLKMFVQCHIAGLITWSDANVFIRLGAHHDHRQLDIK